MRVTFLAATGTDVGKTHLAEALILAARTPLRVWKPYESGVGQGPSDSERLAAAVARRGDQLVAFEPPLARFAAPLAPPYAARAEGRAIRTAELAAALQRLGQEEELLVELAGGLFAPLTDTWLGIDAVQAVPAARVLLVAPNRLGVLHDVIATTRAARPVAIDRIYLSAVARPDASASTNAGALRDLVSAPVVELPRASATELARVL